MIFYSISFCRAALELVTANMHVFHDVKDGGTGTKYEFTAAKAGIICFMLCRDRDRAKDEEGV